MKQKRLKTKTKGYLYYTLFLLVFTLVSCSTLDNTTFIENSLLEANNHLINEENEKALDIYDSILEKEPLNQKALYNKAVVLNYMQQTEKSLQIIDILIENYPENIKAHNYKIKILKQSHDYASIIDSYNQLLESNINLYNVRVQFIEFLLSINTQFKGQCNDQIKQNALFLLDKNEQSVDALKALCTIDKNNAEYSALLFLIDKKVWESIFKIEI